MLQIGPRLELQLIKVQEGVAEGRVLFHRFEERSSADIASQQIAIDEATSLRAERRRQQEENVRKKAHENARIQAALQVLSHLITAYLCCGVAMLTY
jgi:ribosome biogenesis protein SSF1/2